MSDERVIDSFDPPTGIGRITFDRPEVLNAIDFATAVAFRASVASVTALDGLRCIVLAGAGRAFVAGGDVASFVAEPARSVEALLDALHPATSRCAPARRRCSASSRGRRRARASASCSAPTSSSRATAPAS